MDISYLSIIIFLIVTYVYYAVPGVGKIPLTLDMLRNGEVGENMKKNLSRLGIYMLLIIVTQFGLNSVFLINKCGGSAGQNIGTAAILTFFPWLFIFGILIAVLIMYPGLKTAFSDVVGYFVIAGKANQLLTSILVDIDIEESIEKATDMSDGEKLTMKKAADAMLKLCGNKSILINKMYPTNFLSMWEMLKPLMKDKGNIPDLENIQKDLFNLVILKDNIGESLWYIYTAILITSIISYNLASKSCKKSVDQLKSDHDEYLKQEEQIQSQKDLNESTPMTITG